jgi:predicted metal-dependent hydrolase
MTSTTFICGNHHIPLSYKPHQRAKRLSLRLSAKDQSLVLTIPPRTSTSQITAFLKRCIPWVEKNIEKLTKTTSILPGAELMLNGERFRCVSDPLRRKPVLCQKTQTLRLPPQYLEKDLHAFFKTMAEKTLSPYVRKAAAHFGEQVSKITIRDGKSRWGSCSAKKTISLSWRLILAPPEVAYYVCIHEAAHLIHMNHSPAFWKAVEGLCPAYRSHRQWLKANGHFLMTA